MKNQIETSVELSDEEKIRIAKNTYMRRWRKKNKAKQKEYDRRVWLKYYNKQIEAPEMEGNQ